MQFNKLRLAVLSVLAINVFSPLSTFADEKKPYIVQFKDSYIGKTESAKLLLESDVRASRLSDFSKESVKFTKTFDHLVSASVLELSEKEAARISKLKFIESVEPDELVSPSTGWAVDRINQHYLPLDNNFYRPYRGAGINIYIIDTGINVNHTEFTGRVGTVTNVVSGGGGAGDCQGHGTHVASLAAGSAVGVASDATVHSVKISNNCINGDAFISDMLAAFTWVSQNGLPNSVVNLSYSSTSTAVASAMYNLIVGKNYIVVTAAGNNNLNACTDPTAVKSPLALIVGGTRSDDLRYQNSNYGACVDLFAPGESVYGASFSSNTGYVNMTGTSMASPMVAGVAAIYRQRFPNAGYHETMEAIIDGATSGVVIDAAGSPNRLAFTDVGQPNAYWRPSGFIPAVPASYITTVPNPGCTAGQSVWQMLTPNTSRQWICQ